MVKNSSLQASRCNVSAGNCYTESGINVYIQHHILCIPVYEGSSLNITKLPGGHIAINGNQPQLEQLKTTDSWSISQPPVVEPLPFWLVWLAQGYQAITKLGYVSGFFSRTMRKIKIWLAQSCPKLIYKHLCAAIF